MARKRRGRGEGSICQRGDGLWVGTVSFGYNAVGKRRRCVVYGKTKQQVQEKIRQVQTSGIPCEASHLTVEEYLNRWLENTVQGGVAPSTHDRYRAVLVGHVIPHLGRVKLSKLAPLHIEQLFGKHRAAGVSARNSQMAGIVLGTALRHAVRLHLVSGNPCESIKKPRPHRREMKTWDADQTRAFLKTAEVDRFYTLYVLAIATGMRQGELFALSWSDVNFDAGAVMVQRTLEEIRGRLRVKETKTVKGRRRIDLPALAVESLHQHRKVMLAEGHAGGPVFCDTTGNHLRKSNFLRRSYAPILVRANIPKIRFHDLRHTAASLLLLEGEHPKVVSERLGHASIEITLNTYSHVLPTLQKQAASKLDRLLG